MLLLRRLRHNVALQWLRRYSSASNSTSIDDSSNAFISYDANAKYTPPTAESLTNAGLSHINFKQPEYQNIKIAVKDNICTLDFPTTCASHILEGFRSPYEATVISLLKQRGAKIVGKTNMDEFGMGSHSTNSYFGPVVQRYTGADGKEAKYSAGGSSGGSAVAVQQRKCTAALGTDTGGSVRLPAAWCGVVGFKPSYGLISRWGVVDYANSFDTVGILARTVHQVEKLFNSISRPDKQDPTSLSASTTARVFPNQRGNDADGRKNQWTVGVPVQYNVAELAPLVKEAWMDALELCQANGYRVVPVSLPSTKAALSAYYVLAPAEASSNLAKYDGVRYGTRAEGADGTNGILFSKTRAEGLGNEVKRRILLGSYSLSADAIDNYFIQAQKVRRLVQMEFNSIFAAPHPLLESSIKSDFDWESGPGLDTSSASDFSGKVDFILCPTAPTPPLRLECIENQTPVEAYINDVFTVPASMAGLPAISIPWGRNASAEAKAQDLEPGMNVGLQIIGQFGRDHQVIGFAKRLTGLRKMREEEQRST